jgi:eukaryotic-like serine/threonine-protein kinase
MATKHSVLYEFGPFRVDPDRQILLRENRPVTITPKAFETLLILVRHSREDLSKDELMKSLWPETFVEETTLSQNIFRLRKALGDMPEGGQYVVTLPGRGYRFTASVRTISSDGENLFLESQTRSEVIFDPLRAAPAAINPVAPTRESRAAKWKWGLAIATAAVVAILAGVFFFRRDERSTLREADFVVLGDFANTTGDPVFSDALRQGLTVQLEQSPYLNLVPDNRIQQTLDLMGRPRDASLTPELAKEVCERAGAAAVLDGSIRNLGSQYVLGLRARACSNGKILDEEQAQAATKEQVLTALGEISNKFRARVGESVATVTKYDTPLAEATTPSLEALKAYSAGWRAFSIFGHAAAVPMFKRAIEIDPQFAMGYASLGRMYSGIEESTLSRENAARAYELRERASERERFFITANYHVQATGNLALVRQACEAWIQAYPYDMRPYGFLGSFVYLPMGNYEQGIEQLKKSLALDPNLAIHYAVLALGYQYLGRTNDAEQLIREAEQRNLQLPDFFVEQYDFAFLKNDGGAMERAIALSRGVSGAEDWVDDHESFSLAYVGHLKDARQMSQRAVTLAKATNQSVPKSERAALFETPSALREAFLGYPAEARRSALAALAESTEQYVEFGSAFALALSDDSTNAENLLHNLEKRFPEDTSIRFIQSPCLKGLLALKHGEPAKAIELLRVSLPYDFAVTRGAMHGNFGAMYPAYVRGEAYLALRRGPEAAAEFQKILDHPGIVGNDLVGALARLQLARSYAIAKRNDRAKASYADFLALWKDADSEIPILRRAKAEYANLN